MTAMHAYALSSVRAHRASLTGTAIIMGLAGLLLAATGVLLESGVRSGIAGARPDGSDWLLSMLAASFAGTTVVVVILMVASTVAGALRQRRRELALLRALGATGPQVRRLVSGEVLVVLAVAGPLGAIPGLWAAQLLVPSLEAGGVVAPGAGLVLSPLPVLAALALLVPTALLAARLAAREAVRTAPSAALSQARVEPAALGRGRRLAAAWVAGVGVVVALAPFVVPGVLGSAAGAGSALLLITAGALAGPAIVAWCAQHGLRLVAPLGSPGAHLALVNARGFSRRLTTAIVPLALLVALGTVQTSLDRTMSEGAELQLRDALGTNLVVESPPAGLAGLAGVAASGTLGVATAQVQIEDGDADVSWFDGLTWEPMSMRVFGAGAEPLVDPGVTDGALADLGAAGTVSVGRDALLATGKRVGDEVRLRWGGTEYALTIAAIHERTLGLGDLLVGEATLAGVGIPVTPAIALVQPAPGAAADVTAALTAAGATVSTADAYADDATASSGGLSTILMFALLAFVALAAASSLAMLASQRGGELTLLRRTGATGGQLATMAVVEAAFITGAAWLLGAAAVVPSLVGASFGLLGTVVPTVDLTMHAGLVAVVVLVATTTTIPAVLRRR